MAALLCCWLVQCSQQKRQTSRQTIKNNTNHSIPAKMTKPTPSSTTNNSKSSNSSSIPLQQEHPHHAGAAEALRLKAGDHQKQYGSEGFSRKLTEVEEQVIAHESSAEHIVEALPQTDNDASSIPLQNVDLFLPESLQKDCVFVGHVVTDLDSVAGSIGAADFYGGRAGLASKVNSETQFALEYWGIDIESTLSPIEDILKEDPHAAICLVDHQQTSQMHPSIQADKIVGVIDHHALQSRTIVTDKPIYMDIRPWGSMSTIIAHTYLTHRRRPPRAVAGMLLCAILSDTLNLLGPTTTEWDRLMVAVLAELTELDDIQLLASQQFKAKSKELASTSAFGLVNGDQKTFSFKGANFEGDIGFAVVETTDDQVILDKLEQLLPELVACKKEKQLSAIFLAIVNIVQLKSCLLLCGPTERALAEQAFGGAYMNSDGDIIGQPVATSSDTASAKDETLVLLNDDDELTKSVMDLGKRVSRKKDFIPTITSTIKNGWAKPTTRGMSSVELDQLGTLEVDPSDPHGNVLRKGSILDSPRQGKNKKKMKLLNADDVVNLDDIAMPKADEEAVVSDDAQDETPTF